MDAPPNPASDDTTTQVGSRQRMILLAGLLMLAGVLCWSQWLALASAQDTLTTACRQLDRMGADAERIEALRTAPQSAAGRSRANEELLAQVERSLAAAGIDRSKWQDSIPQPPVRVPKTDYRRLTTRLYLQEVTLRQLASFTHHLQENDPTLHISALNLTNRAPQTPSFDVDLALSYLVYSPQRRGAARAVD